MPAMPRQSRIDAPGAVHHIICRGLERNTIFHDDTDRDNFVLRLATILKKTSTTCFAWALIPNHFHLLLRTGTVPVSTVMRRLLTGYAVVFNRRHNRHGHLFQNRYKSILCQEEPYLLELVRYIHLNPLRAGIVNTMKELKEYRYSGHNRLLGKDLEPWQATDEVLQRFDNSVVRAQEKYSAFVSEGVAVGKRPELVGGGLLRSAGGWSNIEAARRTGVYLISDERILGDSSFAEQVLNEAEERMDMRDVYRSQGVDLERIAQLAASLVGVDAEEVWKTGKKPLRSQARSLLCYWATRELGLTATSVGRKLCITQSAVSRAAERGEELATKRGWQFRELTNV
jgi:REP element-mobilizing transposase RayT